MKTLIKTLPAIIGVVAAGWAATEQYLASLGDVPVARPWVIWTVAAIAAVGFTWTPPLKRSLLCPAWGEPEC